MDIIMIASKLRGVAFLLVFAAMGIFNANAQDAIPVGITTVAANPVAVACSIEFIEVNSLKSAKRGIEIVLEGLSLKEPWMVIKDLRSFRSTIASLEEKELVSTFFSQSMMLSSGKTGSIKAAIDSRDIELSLLPLITPNGYEVDFKVHVIQPDDTCKGARRTNSVESRWQGKLGEPFAINVTKLFSDDSAGNPVILLMILERQNALYR